MKKLNTEAINEELRKIIDFSGSLDAFTEIVKSHKRFYSCVLDFLPGFNYQTERNVLSFLNDQGIILDLLKAKNADEQGEALRNLSVAIQKYASHQQIKIDNLQPETLQSALAKALGLDLDNLAAIQFLSTYNCKKNTLLNIMSETIKSVVYLNMKKETLLLESTQKKISDDVLKVIVIGNSQSKKYELQSGLMEQNDMSFSKLALNDYKMKNMCACVEVKYGKNMKVILHNSSNITPMEIPYDKLEEYFQPAITNSASSLAPYSKLELQLPLDALKRGMQFFTFELDQVVSRNSKFMTNYLSQANAILFVFDTTKLCSNDEMNLIENRFSNYNVPIMFVVNNFDLIIKQEDRDWVVKYVNKTLSKFTSSPIYFVSSKQAMEAKQKQNNNLLEKSGIIKIKDELNKMLYTKVKSNSQTAEAEWHQASEKLETIIEKANIQLTKKRSALSEKIKRRTNQVPKYKTVKVWNKLVALMDSVTESNYKQHETQLNELKVKIEQLLQTQ